MKRVTYRQTVETEARLGVVMDDLVVDVAAFVLDEQQAYIDTPKLDLVARSYGAEYVRTGDKFDLQRPVWRDWIADHPEHQ